MASTRDPSGVTALPRIAVCLLLLTVSCVAQETVFPSLACGSAGKTNAPPVTEAEVVVYGATAAGTVAAVAAARHGRSVLLLEPGRHVGGMTSGGLGYSDLGNPSAVGGIAREFYRRVGAAYGGTEVFQFEPRAAEAVLRCMLEEAAVSIRLQSEVVSVAKSGTRVLSVTTAAGDQYKGRVFIDASYEGDLLALAGVSYVVGREANSTYDETQNGVRVPFRTPPFTIDPYVVPGVPESGLLPHVQPGPVLPPGSADDRVQAYTYRLCVTTRTANRLPFPAPEAYDHAEFELLARLLDARVEAGETPRFEDVVYLGPLPNGKFDLNNNGLQSTDLVGGSDGYPDASPNQRRAMAYRHRQYILGFLHFLATSPRVPPSIRAEVEAFGLCKDEFTDTGGWPHQLYVREARRMVGRYVMTEHDLFGRTQVPDPVALGSYALDSHLTQRLAISGEVRTEGGFFVTVPFPYPIAYRATTPREEEADNLLVAVGVSASHSAFGSLRMEPVHMALGHATGVAASLATQEDVAVQAIDYTQLRDALLEGGQIIALPQ